MIGLINYGMGNLGSVRTTFEILNIENSIISSPQEVKQCTKLVLPGVGNFSNAMKILNEDGWVEAIYEHTLNAKRPLLGICLGMQLLSKKGSEGGSVKGLGLIDGTVEIFNTNSSKIRVPHIGWNSIENISVNSKLLAGLKNDTDFYFVHSYFLSSTFEDTAATTNYGIDFCSVVERDNIFGTQFHPEKSSKAGRIILENFSKI